MTPTLHSPTLHEPTPYLYQVGLVPRVAAEAPPGEKVPYVLFAAPPSGSEDYVAEIEAALDRWDG